MKVVCSNTLIFEVDSVTILTYSTYSIAGSSLTVGWKTSALSRTYPETILTRSTVSIGIIYQTVAFGGVGLDTHFQNFEFGVVGTTLCTFLLFLVLIVSLTVRNLQFLVSTERNDKSTITNHTVVLSSIILFTVGSGSLYAGIGWNTLSVSGIVQVEPETAFSTLRNVIREVVRNTIWFGNQALLIVGISNKSSLTCQTLVSIWVQSITISNNLFYSNLTRLIVQVVVLLTKSTSLSNHISGILGAVVVLSLRVGRNINTLGSRTI